MRPQYNSGLQKSIEMDFAVGGRIEMAWRPPGFALGRPKLSLGRERFWLTAQFFSHSRRLPFFSS
jgi:hypothetical protein